MRAVREPAKFITASVDSKPSGLRHLLREMQNRKRKDKLLRNDKIERMPGSYQKSSHNASVSNVSNMSRKPPSSLAVSAADVFRSQNRHIGRVNG